MIKDAAQARDMMVQQLLLAWNAARWGELGLSIRNAPGIAWQGRSDDLEQSAGLSYARWQAKQAEAPQAGIGDSGRQRRFEVSGLITLQCLGALAPGDGFEVAERMAIIARDAYRDIHSDCISFRNCRIQEVGKDRGWYLVNMYADYTYDEVSNG